MEIGRQKQFCSSRGSSARINRKGFQEGLESERESVHKG